jgi:hypothetical protein
MSYNVKHPCNPSPHKHPISKTALRRFTPKPLLHFFAQNPVQETFSIKKQLAVHPFDY